MTTTKDFLDEVGSVSAKNYKPLPVVLEKGEGAAGSHHAHLARLP